MSDVRLSNGSPTLERTEPRVSEHPKPSACRSLFGSVDHEELKKDLKEHLREMEETASAKWGFDFANHTPLVNERLQWELVDLSCVPEFYHRSLRRHGGRGEKGVCSAGINGVDVNGNHNNSNNNNHRVLAPAPGEDSEGAMECTEHRLRKRPASHETSAQSKRSHSSSSSSSGSPEERTCPGLSRSTEHTPRKSSPKRQT